MVDEEVVETPEEQNGESDEEQTEENPLMAAAKAMAAKDAAAQEPPDLPIEVEEAEAEEEDAEEAASEAEAPAKKERPKPTLLGRGQGIAEQEMEFDDDRRWYVVHCYSGYENKVRHAIQQRTETMEMEDRIFDVIVPTEEEIEIKEGKRRTVERRVFPGYVLVQMVMDEDSWYVVRNTPGVTGFVGMGNNPTPLTEPEVQAIMQRMEADAPQVKVTFKPGEKVRIIDGPFNDIVGTVEEIDMERAKVRVMVSFFGRETPVELDFLQVEKT